MLEPEDVSRLIELERKAKQCTLRPFEESELRKLYEEIEEAKKILEEKNLR